MREQTWNVQLSWQRTRLACERSRVQILDLALFFYTHDYYILHTGAQPRFLKEGAYIYIFQISHKGPLITSRRGGGTLSYFSIMPWVAIFGGMCDGCVTNFTWGLIKVYRIASIKPPPPNKPPRISPHVKKISLTICV